MHPDFLQAAAAERIERLERQARESALHRMLRAARARRRSGEEPGGGLARATPEQPPAVPAAAALGGAQDARTASPAGHGTAVPQQPTPTASTATSADDRVPAGR